MKKIKLKLTYDEMDCFISIIAQFAENYQCTDLVRATLLQLYFRINTRTQFRFARQRSLQLTMPESIALCSAIGKVTLNHFEPFALSVISSIYETIQKQLHP